MSFSEYLSIAFLQIRKNKLRTILTILGIVIGIASMITVVSVGEGGQKQINSELIKFGINRVWLYTEDSINGSKYLKLSDAELLKKRLNEDITVAPAVYKGAIIESGGRRVSVDLAGVTADIADIESFTLKEGRFLNANDDVYMRRVIVLSDKVAEKLFKKSSAVNKSVTLNGASFKVVGVTTDENSLVGSFLPQKSYLSAKVFLSIMNVSNIDEISIMAPSTEAVFSATKNSVDILSKKYGEDSVKMVNLAKEMENANAILDTFKLIISAIAAISLLVGGIGIMNIMLVTVKERTHEIGIRKACGARDMQIFGQFLSEASIFAIFGGVFGIILGAAFTFLAQSFVGLEFSLSGSATLLSVLISALLGMCFGIFPAIKASKLNTVDALRSFNN